MKMFRPKDQNKYFIQKVYCENSNPDIEVRKLEQTIREFAFKIIPSEANMIEQRRLAQMVTETLKSNSNFNIARVIFAGSLGKRTHGNKSDIDCVLFINDEHPPFNKMLMQMFDIYNQSALQNQFDIKLNRFSMKLYNKSFEMDVVLATNFVKDIKNHQSLAHIQQKHALRHIKMNQSENSYLYSSALAEASVYFMKTRVGFANEIARMAKYWFKSSDKKDHISGASTMIELMATYAARKGRRGNRKFNPYLKAFIRFLKLIMEFESLNVVFPRCNPMFAEHTISANTKPRVIDPVNPYNNFARHWSDDAIRDLKNSAYETYKQLQNLVVYPSSAEDIIEKLFS